MSVRRNSTRESKRIAKDIFWFSFMRLITFQSVPAKVIFLYPATLAISDTMAISLSSGSLCSIVELQLLVFILRILPLPFPILPVISSLLSGAQHSCQTGIWCQPLLPILKFWNASLRFFPWFLWHLEEILGGKKKKSLSYLCCFLAAS